MSNTAKRQTISMNDLLDNPQPNNRRNNGTKHVSTLQNAYTQMMDIEQNKTKINKKINLTDDQMHEMEKRLNQLEDKFHQEKQAYDDNQLKIMAMHQPFNSQPTYEHKPISKDNDIKFNNQLSLDQYHNNNNNSHNTYDQYGTNDIQKQQNFYLQQQLRQMQQEIIDPLQNQLKKQRKQIKQLLKEREEHHHIKSKIKNAEDQFNRQHKHDRIFSQQQDEIRNLKNQISILKEESNKNRFMSIPPPMHMFNQNQSPFGGNQQQQQTSQGFDPVQMMQLQMMMMNQMPMMNPMMMNPMMMNQMMTGQNGNMNGSVMTYGQQKKNSTNSRNQTSDQFLANVLSNRRPTKSKNWDTNNTQEYDPNTNTNKKQEGKIDKQKQEKKKVISEEKRKKIQRNLRQILIAFLVFKYTNLSIRERKYNFYQNANQIVSQALNLGTYWFQKQFKFYFDDLKKKKVDMLWFTKPTIARKTQCIDMFAKTFDVLIQELKTNKIEDGLSDFICRFVYNNSYLPQNFLFSYELARLEYSENYGFITNSNEGQREMMIIMFMVFRCFVLNTLMNQNYISSMLNNDKKQLPEQMKDRQLSDFAHSVQLIAMKYLEALQLPVHIKQYLEFNEQLKTYPIQEPVPQVILEYKTPEPVQKISIEGARIEGQNMIKGLRYYKQYERAFVEPKVSQKVEQIKEIFKEFMSTLVTVFKDHKKTVKYCQ